MKKLNDYSKKELKRLFNRQNLCYLCKYLKYYVSDPEENKGFDIYHFFYNTHEHKDYCFGTMTFNSAETTLANNNNSVTKKLQLLKERYLAMKMFNDMNYWMSDEEMPQSDKEYVGEDPIFHCPIYRHVPNPAWNFNMFKKNTPKGTTRTPQEMLEEYHALDNMYKENDMATDEEVYKFMWETLRYMDKKELNDLIKYIINLNEDNVKSESSNSIIRQVRVIDNTCTKIYDSTKDAAEAIGKSPQWINKYIQSTILWKEKQGNLITYTDKKGIKYYFDRV